MCGVEDLSVKLRQRRLTIVWTCEKGRGGRLGNMKAGGATASGKA